jgi:hypothetical protein
MSSSQQGSTVTINFRPIAINTVSVNVILSGFGAGTATVYADNYYFSERFGMPMLGGGILTLPNDIGLSMLGTGERWLWFRVVMANGRNFISKGRIKIDGSPVSLNMSDMIGVGYW